MNKTILTAAIAACLACSCTKQSLETTFNTQDARIDSWISSFIKKTDMTQVVTDKDGNIVLQENGQPVVETIMAPVLDKNGKPVRTKDGTADSTATVRPVWKEKKGCYRVICQKGVGDTLTVHKSAKISYEAYIFTSSPSQLVGTNKEQKAIEQGWSTDGLDFNLLKVSPADKNLVEGLRNALVGVQAKEICYILFSGKYGMGKKKMGLVPGNSALCYYIYVDSIQ